MSDLKGTISQEEFDKLPAEEQARYGFVKAGTQAEMADAMRRAETPEEYDRCKAAYLAAGHGAEDGAAASQKSKS